MIIFKGLFKSRDKPTNSYDSPSYTYFFGRAHGGKRVDDRSAMQHTVVYACVRVLSEAIAQLPLHLYQYTENGKERVPMHPLYFLLHDQPNPEMTSFIFRETLMSHLLIYGNAYAQIIHNGRGDVVGLYPLMPDKMNLTVWLNSPGGDVFAASQIYTMLRNHKGKVTVKIDALAASAASVVAMAGDETFIAPTAMLMIHDPATIAMGNKSDMEKAITLLEEVKESIINAYEMKTHLSRSKIAKMMSDETWLNAKKAKQLGFVDGILFDKEKMPQAEPEEDEEESSEEESEEDPPDEDENPDEEEKKLPQDMRSMMYTPSKTVASFMQKVSANTGTPIAQLDKRLELLKY